MRQQPLEAWNGAFSFAVRIAAIRVGYRRERIVQLDQFARQFIDSSAEAAILADRHFPFDADAWVIGEPSEIGAAAALPICF